MMNVSSFLCTVVWDRVWWTEVYVCAWKRRGEGAWKTLSLPEKFLFSAEGDRGWERGGKKSLLSKSQRRRRVRTNLVVGGWIFIIFPSYIYIYLLLEEVVFSFRKKNFSFFFFFRITGKNRNFSSVKYFMTSRAAGQSHVF